MHVRIRVANETKKGTYQINEYLHNRIYSILAIYRN